MIKFIQHSSKQYPPRTYENASADVTLAFAFDFSTPGERLTHDAARSQGKLYIPINPNKRPLVIYKIVADADLINSKSAVTFNIAGNGAYTTIKYGYTQEDCNKLVAEYLSLLFEELNQIPMLIRSGGQSGFDEAGLNAAIKFDIPGLCVCPNGWKFMNVNGLTICDEQQFKNRFPAEFVL